MYTKKYLKRIGIDEGLSPTLSSLKRIHKQHLTTVPFENLDMHIYKHIETNVSALYRKIVENMRGGICYELNLLLAEMLRNIGFDTVILGAKMAKNGKGYSDHMLLKVSLEGVEYLVDVGCSDYFLEPLLLEVNVTQKDKNGLFKIEQLDESRFEFKKYCTETDLFRTKYTFVNRERDLEYFKGSKEYDIHSDDSSFKKKLICLLQEENGRLYMKQNNLVIIRNDSRVIEKRLSFCDYINVLKERYGIKLSLDEIQVLRLVFEKLVARS